ncbi:MAG: response regulator [Fibrobacter sp.]|nr:response regulator [Fibrobacter sp.]
MKILVVDDSKMMRHVLTKQLHEIGYKIILEAENVETALRIIKTEQPDLILSDWIMPDSTGLELLKTVRKMPSTQNIPFVMVTTQKEQKHIIEASRAGLQCYLLKPIQTITLIEKLTSLATAYGFDPPTAKLPSDKCDVPVAEPQNEMDVRLNDLLKGTMKVGDIERIAAQFQKFIDGEFSDSIKNEYFSSLAEDKKDEVQYFLDSVKSAVADGVTTYLERFLS